MLKEYLSNIANAIRNKLETTDKINAEDFANKVDEVYKAGQLNALESVRGEVNGVNIRVDDVSNIEHNVPCRLESKNLINADLFPNFTKQEDGSYLSNTNIYTSEKIEINLPPAIYTVSYSLKAPVGTNYRIQVTYEDGTIIGTFLTSTGEYKTATYTTDGRAIKYIGFYYGGLGIVQFKDLQLELGSTATPYTPYITDFSQVEVSRYGKNLFLFKQGAVSGGTASIVEELDNGAICQGVISSDTQHNAWGNGWYTFAHSTTITLKAGDTVTISCDYTVLELAEGHSMDDFNSYGNKKANIYLYHPSGGTNNLTGAAKNQPTILGEPTRLYITYTVKADGDYYPIFTLNSNKVRIENIQVEIGSTSTTYESYKEPQVVTINIDGAVEDVTSVAPSMSLIPNNSGVIINAEYYRDIDIILSDIAQAVALSGGVQ